MKSFIIILELLYLKLNLIKKINSAINLILILILINLNNFNRIYVNGFNLENRLPIVKYGENSSYFGYSVATHIEGEKDLPTNPKWLLVGAPLGNNMQPNTNHSGALYKCPITQNIDDCKQVITDGRRSYDEADEKLQPPLFDDEIKDGQWLGVTVRSQGVNGKVMVCAHRYITKVHENRYGQGLCYVLSNDLKYDEVYEPCKGRTVQRAHEEYGYCQVGTSGALLEDNTMVLGTPGPYTWRGTIFVTEIGGEYLERDKNMYYGDHTDAHSPVDKYSYLGMAVTGGKYFSDEMNYAAGAPRSNGHGQVVIFTKSNTNPMPVKMIIEGEQFASSFGYELATADVNGDKNPDLLIAAPFYFAKNDGGAVYVYLNNRFGLPSNYTQKLVGSFESRFGIAIANMGDINKDGCDDIAIGAPYDGDGAVFIYLGNRDGLSKTPNQVIHSSDLGLVTQPIKTFGSSLSAGMDLDANSYPDLVVGAYASSATIVLLARPIISFSAKVRGDELKNIDPGRQGCPTDIISNFTCFTFEACCNIESYEGISSKPKPITLEYVIEAETFSNMKKFSRVFFDKDRNNIVKRRIDVKPNKSVSYTCYRHTAYVKENAKDIQTPIKFRLNYTIVESQLPSSGLIGLNPILDKTKADINFEALFQKDCVKDYICESNLTMNVEFNLDKEDGNYALVLGKSDEFSININISNYADSAYEAQLFILHQKSVTYIAANKKNNIICNRYNDTVVACSLGNPMRRFSFAEVSIRFDPSGLEDLEYLLNFTIFANTTSDLIGRIPHEDIQIKVVKKAVLTLSGWASPEQSFYGGEIKGESAMEYLEDIGSSVIHTYQIYNDGPWKAPKISLTINWPRQVANDKPKGKWLLYLEDSPTIDGMGNCVAEADSFNPLKLTKRPYTLNGLLDNNTPSEKYILKSDKSSALTYESSNSKSSATSVTKFENNTNEVHLNRVRRDRSMKIRAERLSGKDGKKHDVVTMDCDQNTAFCVKIKCDLYNIMPKTETQVTIKARLWNSTLVVDYPRVDLIKVISRGQIKIPKELNMEEMDSVLRHHVETKAYPELMDQIRDSSTPTWIIILSVIGGLLVLAIVAFGLWKCGFFKRRRPDPTLSGNIEKNSEHKPFIAK